MPTIILNKKVFEHLVGKKIPLEQLKDRISMLGTDLEKIEGNKIEVEIFPNRPDMLSEQGFARAFSSFIGSKTGLKRYEVKKSGQKIIIDDSVKGIRPFTACAIVKGLKFDDERIREVIQVQEKLHITYGRNRKKAAIGIYPLEKITFPVTYRADKPENIKFRPLEAKREMTALQILSQHKTGREFGHLLEGLERFPYFIDAKKKILSMPPIINSHNTGKISQKTKDVFVECSGFDYRTLRICLNIVVSALAEMGGKIYSLEIVYDKKKTSPDFNPEKMKLDLKYINQILGLKLKEKDAKGLLERMGYGYEKGNVLVPAYRSDVLHQADLAEDIAIAYGYENFKEEIPDVATIGEENPAEKLHRKISELLVGFKLLEVKNYHLLQGEEMNKNMCQKEKLIPLKNSLGDYNHLRNSILTSLVKNLKENQHNEFPQNIFEIGRVFFQDKKVETGIGEKEKLGMVVCHEKVDFTEIKQLLDGLMAGLGLTCEVREKNLLSFISGRAGEIFVSGKRIGLLGEFSPEVLTNWELVVPVVGMEIDLDRILELV